MLALAFSAFEMNAQTKWKSEVDALVEDAPAYNEYNENRRGQFKVLPIKNTDIVFMGDSITDRCEWGELLDNTNIKNRGISGDRVRWMFDRYEDVANGHPAKIFLMIGVNDLRASTKSHDCVIMIAELVTRIHKITPETKIYIQSILPNNLDNPKQEKYKESTINVRIDNCNKWLEKWCGENDFCTYVNIASALMDSTGQMDEAYTLDGLHPNAVAYLIWKDIIEDFVEE